MPDLPAGAVTAAMGVASTHADVERWRTAAEGTAGGLLMRKQLLTEALEAAAPVLAAELAELRARLGEYENAVTWNTSCLSCAKVLDSCIAEHERAERATETERARILAMLRRAASGRREYEQAALDGSQERKLLDQAAMGYEAAAALIEDPALLLDVIPSWRWTPEETASLHPERVAGEQT